MTGSRPPAPLRRGVLWTVVGNAVYLGSQYGMLMAVAKLGNKVFVGEFSLALALVTPVLIFSQMQLRQVFVTDTSESVPFTAFFWTRAGAGIVAVAAVVGIVAVLGYDARFQMLTALMGTAKLAESQSDMVYAALQRSERMELVAGSMIARGGLGLTAVALGLWWTGSLVAAIAGLAIVWAVIYCVLDLGLLRFGGGVGSLRWRWDWMVVWRLVQTSTPLTMAAGLVSLSAAVPRYFLEAFGGKAAVAVFAVAMTPVSLMGLFTGAVSQATLARASVYLQRRRFDLFHRLAQRLAGINLLIGVSLVALLVAAGRPLIRLLFTPEYETAVPVMVILGAGVALSGLAAFGSTVATASRRFVLQLVNVVVALAVQVPACLLLVPRFGVAGAAWAEFAKFIVTTLFLVLAGRTLYRRLRAAPDFIAECSVTSSAR